MLRSLRVGGLALVASLLLHAVLFVVLDGNLPSWVQPPEPMPFSAQLRPAVVAKPAAPAHPVVPHSASPKAVPERPPSLPSFAESDVAPMTAVDVPLVPQAETHDPVLPEPLVQTEQAMPSLETPAEPALSVLPPRLSLRYQVQYGLASGEQTMVWARTDDRYTITSVAGATGLAGMFYRGQFVQTSSGRITSSGLQPDTFWDQRGDKRSSARFDTEQGRITYVPAKGAPRHFSYQGAVQDVASLFFQLALTSPSPGDEFGFNVFNGKKLRYYLYGVRGEVLLDTPSGKERTLHLVRENDQDGRFEIWLAIDRHYLPVRVLKRDENGNEVELRLLSMTD